MKKVLKYALAIIVIVALAAALSYLMFYIMFLAIVIAIFYTGGVWFVLGFLVAGIGTWIGLQVFDRSKIYSVEEGVHYETTK